MALSSLFRVPNDSRQTHPHRSAVTVPIAVSTGAFNAVELTYVTVINVGWDQTAFRAVDGFGSHRYTVATLIWQKVNKSNVVKRYSWYWLITWARFRRFFSRTSRRVRGNMERREGVGAPLPEIPTEGFQNLF